MGDWALGDASRWSQLTSGAYGATVTASASVNTKGSWTQIIASAPFDIIGLMIGAEGPTSVRDVLYDIGIGGAGSEQVLIANLYCYHGSTYGRPHYYIPIAIPAGTRIAARCQSTTGSTGLGIMVLAVGGSWQNQTFRRCQTMGANTADSGGTSIDPGGSADTKGAWFELASATLFPVKSLFFAVGNQLNNARQVFVWGLDIGIGSAGNEQVILPNYVFISESAGDTLVPASSPVLPFVIPTGTRVAARAQCTNTDAADRLFDLIAYGLG